MQHEESLVAPSSPFVYARRSIPHVGHPERNEDRIIADARLGLAVVLDGVGSTAGAVASRIAARAIRRGWQRFLQDAHSSQNGKASHRPDIPAALQQILEETSAQLQPGKAGAVDADGKPADTATTVALAVFYQQHPAQTYTMFYAHVGDSRIYLLRSGQPLARLTEDDSYMTKLVNENRLSKADALRIDQAMHCDELPEPDRELFDKRNGITQALGDTHPITVHLGQLALIPGDRALLCSDGIHDNLLDSEIEETLCSRGRTTAARVLVQRALQRSQEDTSTTLRPKSDDMSALVVTYKL